MTSPISSTPTSPLPPGVLWFTPIDQPVFYETTQPSPIIGRRRFLTVLGDAERPRHVILSAKNCNNEYRPVSLTADQVRELRDACNAALNYYEASPSGE